MTVEKRKRIQAKEFARDVEAGMSPAALMGKYALSMGQLQRAFVRLEEKGLLNVSASERVVTRPAAQRPPSFTCPSCGAVHSEDFPECPNCGIVLAKIHDHGEPMGSHPRPVRREDSSSRSFPPAAADRSHKRLFQFVGMVFVLFLILAAFLVYRWMRSAQNLATARNVQAVLHASNAVSKPDYSRVAQMFGSATGATAAVMANRRTALNEKMHEIYQKLYYLGELQTRMRGALPGTAQGIGAYMQAGEAVGHNRRPVDRELEAVRRGLADAREGTESAADSSAAAQQQPPVSAVERVLGAQGREAEQNGSTAAQFARAEDELRSLCSEVLRLLDAR